MKRTLTLFAALLFMPLATLGAADKSAAPLLPLTPEVTGQLEGAHKANLIEIAPVHLPPAEAGDCNHYGWPIATMTGDTIVVMHRRIPGHKAAGASKPDPTMSYGIVLRSEDGGKTWSLPYDLRDCMKPEDRERGIFFDQDWGSMPGAFAVASGGIHVWHMPALVTIFGDDSVLQFGGGTLGHPWGNAAGACANRVALEACVQARNEGRAVEKEGKEILTAAAQHSPELKIAMETWKEIKFEFDTVDKLDVG